MGWLTALGHIFFSAASAFVFSTLVTAFAILCNPDYVNSRWHTTLICWCVIGLALVFNLYGVRLFTVLNSATAILGVTTLLSVSYLSDGRFCVQLSNPQLWRRESFSVLGFRKRR